MSAPDSKTLTSLERNEFIRYADEYGPHWRDHSSALAKWLLGTLITINTGGMYFAGNANVHPAALGSVYKLFFFGLLSALASASVELLQVRELNEIAFKLKFNSDHISETNARAVRNLFSFWKSKWTVSSLCVASVFFFGLAGSKLVSATTPCSVELLSLSKEVESNHVPQGKNIRTCYFYEIEGLSNEPLQRAIEEERMVRELRELKMLYARARETPSLKGTQ